MFCSSCGKQVEDGYNNCPYCGAPLMTVEDNQNQGYYSNHQADNFNSSQNYQQQYYNTAPNDESSIGFAILSFFVPLVGLILYLCWNNESPKKAKSCAKGAIAGVIVSLVFGIVIPFIFMMFFSALTVGVNTCALTI
ncbi:MAG: zinc ribbon domain-containing protein [Bacteroidales bacterium]|nr:zinc ribbon domain-containing protein [Bacteroidales bacterium]